MRPSERVRLIMGERFHADLHSELDGSIRRSARVDPIAALLIYLDEEHERREVESAARAKQIVDMLQQGACWVRLRRELHGMAVDQDGYEDVAEDVMRAATALEAAILRVGAQ